jgi:hypothetical protein
MTYHNANLAIPIPDGDAGIVATLWVMRACADDAVESGGPCARLATEIAAAAGRDPMEQARAIYERMRQAITFKRDPISLENVRHPDQLALEILEQGSTSADCDCAATLGAALLRCMGILPALIVASTRPGGEFHHVLFGGYIRGRLVTIDPQERMFDQLPPLTRQLVFELR